MSFVRFYMDRVSGLEILFSIVKFNITSPSHNEHGFVFVLVKVIRRLVSFTDIQLFLQIKLINYLYLLISPRFYSFVFKLFSYRLFTIFCIKSAPKIKLFIYIKLSKICKQRESVFEFVSKYELPKNKPFSYTENSSVDC